MRSDGTVPARVDPETHQIICRQKRVYRIEIDFPRSEIRRGH
jgi:adenylate kinase